MKRLIEIEIENCGSCVFRKCIDSFASFHFECPEGETSLFYSYKDAKILDQEQKLMFKNCKTLPRVEE